MVNKDKASIYFLDNNSYNGILDRLVSFLSEDINFLYLDTSNGKEVNKHTVNHKYVNNNEDFLEVINNNRRNLDHIILYIPYAYKVKFIPQVKQILDSSGISYSIFTSRINIDNTNTLDFDSIYMVSKKEIRKNDEVITYDSFTTEYIRTARINDIINSKD